MSHQDSFRVYVSKDNVKQEMIDFNEAIKMLDGNENMIKKVFYVDGKKVVDKKYIENLIEQIRK